MKIFWNYIGKLLHIANATRPSQGFYLLKKWILHRHGEYVGYDLQHIVKDCWRCHGTGQYLGLEDCWCCDATGIYSDRWFILSRWRLGNYTFHIPSRAYCRSKPETTGQPFRQFNEKIRHDSYPTSMARDAILKLTFLFAPQYFLWHLFYPADFKNKPFRLLLVVGRLRWKWILFYEPIRKKVSMQIDRIRGIEHDELPF